MNFKQTGKVPNRGARSEKTSQRLFEALCIAAFLLCLFLTGCSGDLAGDQHRGRNSPVVQLTGEASLPFANEPHLTETSPRADETAAKDESPTGQMKSFIQEEAVIERVRIVTGWLRFMHQEQAMALVTAGWERVNSGKIIGPLKFEAIVERPEASTIELMLWSELIRRSEGNAASAKALEVLAATLTIATSPDDVMHADSLLAISDALPGY